jgi:hypothetical protein
MTNYSELEMVQLYHHTDPERFEFETTDDLEELDQVIGQPRAIAAMNFGVGMRSQGYNIFALGSTGTGKRSVIHKYFEQHAVNEPVPDDWCYVNNFDEHHKPKTIRLTAGKGLEFHEDMQELVDSLNTALSAAFESEEYQSRRQTIN